MKQRNWKGKKVLIIDQDLSESQMICDLLQEVGFECLSAIDSIVGMEIAHVEHPDIILMDWNIPGVDGHEVIEQLKTARDTRTIPIIVLTGSSISNADLCFVLCDKADDYLRKPIDKFELIGRVAASLRLYRVINIVQERSERLARLSHDLQAIQRENDWGE